MLKQFPQITYFTLILLAGCSGGSGGGSSAPTTPPTTPPTSAVPPSGGGAPSSSYVYQTPSDEGDGWSTTAAPALSMNPGNLETMIDAMRSGQIPKIDAISIAYKGRLVLDETLRTSLDRFDQEVANLDPSQHAQFSVSKSIAAIAIGVAIQNGDITSENIPFLSLFDYPNIENLDANKQAIQLKDVLTMRTGIEWNEDDPSYFEANNQLFTFHDANVDWAKGLLDLPMSSAPNQEFAYNTVATTALGQAIENAQPLMLEDYLTTHLALPLQITSFGATRTPTGLPDLGRGLSLKTRDGLKFGQLLLDGGQWNNQRIVSESWVASMTRIETELRWQNPEAFAWQITGFGYQWWTGFYPVNGENLDAFAARGFGNQLIMVIPALELVVAVNSSAYSQTDQEVPVFQLIADHIIPAVVE